MRTFTILLSASIFLLSCNSDQTKTIDPNDVQQNEIMHDSLTSGQIAKIRMIQATFAEVYPVSMEKTLDSFKRDLDPDGEIAIWEAMAGAYTKFVTSKHDSLNMNQKKEAFSLILSRSMMSDEETIASVKPTVLSKEEVKEVLSYYTKAPDPIDVIEKK